jgi:hypothetical protein
VRRSSCTGMGAAVVCIVLLAAVAPGQNCMGVALSLVERHHVHLVALLKHNATLFECCLGLCLSFQLGGA